jgi:hypothetical protein
LEEKPWEWTLLANLLELNTAERKIVNKSDEKGKVLRANV